MRWLIMSHLIQSYTVCPLVFEFLIWYILDLTFLKKIADENFIVCFLVVKELIWFLATTELRLHE